MPGESLSADVAVVGGGGAGLCAAAEAARLGRSVVVIEKAGELGGTTALSVGSIMAAGTRQQRRAGIEDSPAAHARDLDAIRRAMDADDDPELRGLMTENVADTVAFLSSLGINFLGPLPQPPHGAARLHQVMPTSRALIFHLSRHLRRLGVRILVNARATRLLADGRGVTGVEVSLDHRATLKVTATLGVILASGDVAANPELMHKYMKTWVDGVEAYNPLNVGDGHVMAAAVGARIVPRKDLPAENAIHIRFVRPRPSWLQRIPPYGFVTWTMVRAMDVLPDWMIRPLTMKFLTTTLGPDRGIYEHGAILVNGRGERFADERATPGLRIPQQPDGIAYIIFDAQLARKFSRWPYFISTAPGVGFAYFDDYRRGRPDLFFSAASAEALARTMGFSPERFAASLASTRSGEAALATPPFFALGPVKVWAHPAQIGLAVNRRLEVLNEAGAVIPGLYAAGGIGQGGYIVTGHGHGLGWAFTSGRLAARSAAGRFAT